LASESVVFLSVASISKRAPVQFQAVEALVSVLGSEDIDVLENATAALANLVANSDRNSARLFACGGVRAVLQLLSVDRAAESVETHSNAAEVGLSGRRSVTYFYLLRGEFLCCFLVGACKRDETPALFRYCE